MLRFTFTVDISANKWVDDDEKKIMMSNAEDIVQRGLMMMTVPDWIVTVVDAEEIKE